MKTVSLNSENQKEVLLKNITIKNKIRIAKFTSERIDTFPQFIDFTWEFPNGDKKSAGQSPDTFATPYHRQPIYDVWEHISFVLEDVQHLKFSLNDVQGLTQKGEKSNCKIYFEEL